VKTSSPTLPESREGATLGVSRMMGRQRYSTRPRVPSRAPRLGDLDAQSAN
jgi:hypothetical protein